MILLDTDILIDLEHGFPSAVSWLDSLKEPPSLPGFVVMELIQDVQNKAHLQKMIKLSESFSLVWPRKVDCQFALEVFVKFRLSHNIDLLDALIGACAVGLSATLCTFNVKHYKVIPGLVTLQPYKKKTPSGKKP